jgi:hypothetical protein
MAWISCCILGVLYAVPYIAMLLWSLRTQPLRSVPTLVSTAILVTWPGAAPEKSFASEHFVPDGTKQHLVRGALMARP